MYSSIPHFALIFLVVKRESTADCDPNDRFSLIAELFSGVPQLLVCHSYLKSSFTFAGASETGAQLESATTIPLTSSRGVASLALIAASLAVLASSLAVLTNSEGGHRPRRGVHVVKG